MMPAFSSLVAPEVVVKTTSGAASDDKVGINDNFRVTQCSRKQLTKGGAIMF